MVSQTSPLLVELGSGSNREWIFGQGKIQILTRSSWKLFRTWMKCGEGWTKLDPSRAFPTFTTLRPRRKPGHKPARLQTCSPAGLKRWEQDDHRYSPYQYTAKNLLINRRDELRLPNIEEMRRSV